VEPAGKTPATPLRQVGDYRIVREIGRGGMGVVYEAEQSSLGRRVALKVLPLNAGADGKALERFKREARAAARLHHTNIVPVFDVGEGGNVCYYAMQFIQGQGLDQVIAELRRLRSASDRKQQVTVHGEPRTQDMPAEELARSMLTGRFRAQDVTAAVNAETPAKDFRSLKDFGSVQPDSTAGKPAGVTSSAVLPGQTELSAAEKDRPHYFESIARIGRQTASALAHAHERGIIHRDIKPSNLLLDASGIVWVTDFGLAKTEESDLTCPGDILGTFRYMAPERFKGASDPRSDVYALGITLYELLVLRPAFEGCDRATLMAQVADEEPRRPRSLDRRIPRDLETIVMKAIAKDPWRRYQTAEALADDLGRFLENLPIQARRTSTRERLWRWCRRNPAIAFLLTAVFLLLSCLTIGSAAVAIRMSRQSTALAVAEADRTAKVYETYQARLAQAQASRSSQRAGQRFATLEAVREAAELVRQRQMPVERLDELRDLAIAALTLPDLRTLRTWKKLGAHDSWGADPQSQLLARRTPDGSITVTRMDSDAVVARCQGELHLRFSPSGRFLLSCDNNRFRVWDLSRPGPALVAEGEESGFAFHPDGRHLLMGRRDGSLWRYDLESPGQEPSALVTLQPPASGLAYDPEGKRLAVTRGGQAQILDAQSGRLLAAIPEPRLGGTPAWHPSGKYLALISTNSTPDIFIWDLNRTKRLAVLRGCRSAGVYIAFTPDGDRLLGGGWEGIVRLWDWRTGRQLLQQPGQSNLRVSPAGRLVMEDEDHFSLVALIGGREYRSFVQQSAAEEDVSYRQPLVHPGGRLLALNTYAPPNSQRVLLFDLETGDELAAVPQTRWLNAFQSDGTLVTNGDRGLLRWPMHQADPGHWQVGPPILVYPESFVDMACDRTGEVIGQATGRGALLVRPGKGLVFLGPHGSAQHIGISPDGRYAVTGINDGEEGVKLWDTKTRRLLKTFPMGHSCSGGFSPDGRWLSLWGSRGSRVVKVGSWETTCEGRWHSTPFAPDGSLFAAEGRQGLIRLIEPATGRELARLQEPNQAPAAMVFTPDGARLVTSSDVDRAIHVWDLRAIRKQLAALGLDWDAPPYPEAQPTAPLPLEVKVDAGRALLEPRVAIGLCTVRLAFNPLDFEAYFERGKAHGRLHDNPKAIADYSTALALMPPSHPSRGEALLRRNSNYRKLNEPVKAAADLQQIAEEDLALPPELAFIAANQLNDAAWRDATGPETERDPRRALLLIRKAIKLMPEEWMFMNTRGVIHYRLGEYPQAVEWLERSLRESQGEAPAFDLFFLAMCHAKGGEAAKAKDCYDRAVRWVQENPSVLNNQPGWSQELKSFQTEAEGVLAARPTN
jgi:eukaryotic-like serine/threonine-protein kinase